jgi:hypothetical protein
VQCVALHADGVPEHRLALTQQADANVTPVRPVANGLDQSGVGDLVDEKRDARLGAVQLAGECPLHGPVLAAGRDHQEEVIALLGEAESRQRLAHDRLRLGEGSAQLGDERDIGQRVTRQPHALGGHGRNVHGEAIDCVVSPVPARSPARPSRVVRSATLRPGARRP